MKGFIALFALATLVFAAMSYQIDSDRLQALREVVRANTKMQALSLSSNFKMMFVALQSLAQNYNPRERTMEARGKDLLAKQSSFAAFQIHQFDPARSEYLPSFSKGELDAIELTRLMTEAREKGVSIQAASGATNDIYFAIRYGEMADPQHFLSIAKITAAELSMQLDAPSGHWQQASVLINKDGQKVLMGTLEPPASIWKNVLGVKAADGVYDIKSERGESWTVAHAELGVAGLKVVTLLPLSLASAVYRERMKGLAGGLLMGLALYGLFFKIWSDRQRKNEILISSELEEPQKEAQG